MSYRDDELRKLDPDQEDDEEVSRSPWPRWLQPFILIIVMIVVIAMTAVPLLRALAIIDSPESNEERFEQRARQNTALIFAASVLEERSTRLAMRVTAEELRDPVDAIVGGLQSRDGADLEGTEVSLVGISCAGFDDEPDACYSASLSRPNAPPVETILFGVSIVNGRAIVVSVDRTGIVAQI